MLTENMEAGEFDDASSAASALLWLKRSFISHLCFICTMLMYMLSVEVFKR